MVFPNRRLFKKTEELRESLRNEAELQKRIAELEAMLVAEKGKENTGVAT
jgi:hypothetical protein